MTEQALRQFAEKLADEARKIITPHYRNIAGVERKPDTSPVTEVDRMVEQRWREMIEQAYPNHGIIGEEFPNKEAESEFSWYLDPIDGTVSFIAGRPLFCSLIGLAKDNKPILGIIDQPILQERWVGQEGEATLLNDQAVLARQVPIAEAIIATTAPHYLSENYWQKFQTLATQVADVLYGGDAYNYALLASGHIDAVLEEGLKPHDLCALLPVLAGAGVKISDWSGKEVSLAKGEIMAVASSILFDKFC